MYATHNQFEQARIWFSKIIEEDRYSEKAKDAARNIIGTYQTVSDWTSIQQKADQYLKNMIKAGEENSDFAKELKRYGSEANWMIAGTMLKKAQQLAESQRREEVCCFR